MAQIAFRTAGQDRGTKNVEIISREISSAMMNMALAISLYPHPVCLNPSAMSTVCLRIETTSSLNPRSNILSASSKTVLRRRMNELKIQEALAPNRAALIGER